MKIYSVHASADVLLMSPCKDETAVHGCHCPGDIALCMRKVMAIPHSRSQSPRPPRLGTRMAIPRVGVRVWRLLNFCFVDVFFFLDAKTAMSLNLTTTVWAKRH